MRTHYILENGKIRVFSTTRSAVSNHLAHSNSSAGRINDTIDVSTVFLGVDYRFIGDGAPILFETMIFGGPRDQEMWRYSTYGEAKRGHFEVVEECRKTMT
jgi:hypothetical protein